MNQHEWNVPVSELAKYFDEPAPEPKLSPETARKLLELSLSRFQPKKKVKP